MAEQHDLQHQPNSVNSSNFQSGTRAELALRGRSELSMLLAKQRDSISLARVMVNDKWGLIGREGDYVVQPIYRNILPFHEGRCAFCESDEDCDFLIGDPAPKYDPWTGEPEQAGGEEAEMPEGFGRWGFLDASGMPISTARFEWVNNFSEDLAPVQVDSLWGFINQSGEIAIEPQFDDVRDFRDGLCIVFLRDKCGFIDKRGKFVIPPEFDDLGEFSNGLALAKSDGSYGYLDSSGSYVIDMDFAEADNFSCGLARVEWMRFRGYIDKCGTFIYRRMKHKSESLPGLHRSILYRRGNRVSAPPPGLGRFIDCVAYLRGTRRVYESECGHSGGRCDGICGENPCRCADSHRLCRECSFCLCNDCTYGKGVFLDTKGRSILEGHTHLLEPLADFSEGLGLVGLKKSADKDCPGRLCGFVDAYGEMRISAQFLEAILSRTAMRESNLRMLDGRG